MPREGASWWRLLRGVRTHPAELEVRAAGRTASRTPSGRLGRNLCDHLYGTTGYGYLPQLLGQPSFLDNVSAQPDRWMPRWQNLGPQQEKFIRGYSIYPTGGCGEFPWFQEQIEGFGDVAQARDQAALSDAGLVLLPDPVAAERRRTTWTSTPT